MTIEMSGNKERIPLAAIVGPTAVGKTALALELAEKMGAEIVSADSRLLYRGMDIGTAKPSPEEQARVRHHLVDVANPNEVWSLEVFLRAAGTAIEDIWQRGRLPILTGGTGQYVRAILESWSGPKVPPNPQMRLALESWADEVTPAGLHERLRILDPLAAQAIEPNNLRRTVRALEVILSSGRLFSEQRRRDPNPYEVFLVGLWRPRQELYARIDRRIEDMVSGGFVDEVQALRSAGYSCELATFSAIGYQEMCAYLTGRLTLEDAITQMKRRTRNFVRRQANWFKMEDPNIHWFEAGKPDTVSQVEAAVRAWQNEKFSESKKT